MAEPILEAIGLTKSFEAKLSGAGCHSGATARARGWP